MLFRWIRTVLALSPTLFEHICAVSPVGTERSVIATIAAVAGLLMPTSLSDEAAVSGATGGIRIRNFLIHSQGLYQLSYRRSVPSGCRTPYLSQVRRALYR